MKFFIFTFLLCNVLTKLQAQQFHHTVRIEFEKTVYVKQVFKDLEPDWFERIKERLQETSLTRHEFIGDTSHSVFRPLGEPEYDSRSFYKGFADKNVVYNNYKTKKSVAQKPVFEETFLIEDSLLNIKWKLTADTRLIAGYECRKAIGLIDDSITVFAFYTDEILVSGGPESIHGLPGMILGLGMPRIHSTWFATRVEVNGVNMTAVKPVSKGKKISRTEMIQAIEKALKDWGNYGRNLIWNFLI